MMHLLITINSHQNNHNICIYWLLNDRIFRVLEVSCHGVVFPSRSLIFSSIFDEFLLYTTFEKSLFKYYDAEKKMKYKYPFWNATFIADSVYPKIRFRVAGTRSVTTKRNNVNFNINPNLIEITGTWTWNGLSCLCVV